MDERRRDFLKKTGILAAAGLAGRIVGNTPSTNVLGSFMEGNTDLPPLPYAYDALEPFIDKQTMQIHHTKHHQAYIDKLKTAAASDFNPGLDLAESVRKVNDKTPALVRNNLGGHYNHALFWTMMRPNPENKDNAPTGKISEMISTAFKSFEDFRTEFSDKAAKHFGSGWCWLVAGDDRKLKVVTTPNQDNPLMGAGNERGTPILGIDVWEHAYYLKYQNKRADYISAWWKVVNWPRVNDLLAAVK